MMTTTTPPPDTDDIDDLENAIQTFMVRRRPATDSNQNHYYGKNKSFEKIHNHFPLLLCDLKKFRPCLRNGTYNGYEVFGGKVKFRTCLVYGRICDKPMEYRSAYKYWLDDGTDVFPILVSRQNRQQRSLHDELTLLKRNDKEYENGLVMAMRNLVVSSLKELHIHQFELGTKVLVSGRPHRFLGEWVLTVFHIERDRKRSSQLELAFADYVADMYEGETRKR